MDARKDLPVSDTMETSKPEEKGKLFTVKDLPRIAELFRTADADGGGSLDIEEFCCAMQMLHGTANKEEMIALHMKIDTNCDTTVDLGELMDFLLGQNKSLQNMACKNHTFPKPIKVTTVEDYKNIVGLVFCPSKLTEQIEYSGKLRIYQKGYYISITSNAILNFWTSDIDKPHRLDLANLKPSVPYSHSKKISVCDMVYIAERNELAVATSERKLSFYNCFHFPELFQKKYSLVLEDSIVSAMNYTYNGTKALFSIGDRNGYLHVFFSYNVEGDLFNRCAFEKESLHTFPTVYVSSLLKKQSETHGGYKVFVFEDTCTDIRFFGPLNSFCVCGMSSKTMALISLPEEGESKIDKKLFKSQVGKSFFTCADYCPQTERLVTGGTDGKLRVWFPNKTSSCEHVLKGHVRPVTHIAYNPLDKVVVSLSEDKNIRVWFEHGWFCSQSFFATGLPQAPISSMVYNIHNNELVVANSDIGKYLGKGTDVFKDTLTSHNKPLCSALYHSIFKQVVSVCQGGVVTVWNILTGEAVMQFKVIPDQHVGLVAMSFDGPQRRLITVYQDGKVRLWNFNNGTELAVHPVTVHSAVTGIVCINDRVFVSGRDSNIIFDLDINGIDNRYLKHDYLKDISSMDAHDNRLATASSNGNIIIWDADTAEALYWLNINESPRPHMISKKNQGQTGALTEEKTKMIAKETARFKRKNSAALTESGTDVAVNPLILHLKTRETNTNTATLLTSTEGYIYAWSVISKGGLLAKFRAVDSDGAKVTTMSTDVNEELLLTGDSTGKIYIWDIKRFGFKNLQDKGPFEEIHQWRVSLCAPPLLGSWKSHFTGVVTVICDPVGENIITAGWQNVRLWTRTGSYVGLFGKDEWDPTQHSPEEEIKAGTSSTAKKKIFKSPFADPPIQKPRTPSPTNYDDVIERIDDQIRKIRYRDKSIHQLFSEAKELSKYVPDLDRLPGLERLKLTDDLLREDEHEPPKTTPVIGKAPVQKQSSDGTPHLDKYLNQYRKKHERVRLLPRRETLKPNRLIPLPPSPQPDQQGYEDPTPKYEPSPPIPLLPSPLPEQQGSEHKPLPPISEKAQLKHQSKLKPDTPETTLTTGCTEATKSSSRIQALDRTVKDRDKESTKKCRSVVQPPDTIPVIRNGPVRKQSSDRTPDLDKYLNHTKKKLERMRFVPCRKPLHPGSLVSGPPSPLPDQEGSEHKPLPPISEKAQLKHQSKLKPDTPETTLTTGCTEATKSSPRIQALDRTVKDRDKESTKKCRSVIQPPHTIPVIRNGPDLKQSSDRTPHLDKYLNQSTKKYERRRLLPCRETLKPNCLIPLPPSRLPDQQGSEHKPLPPISEKAQLKRQSKLKPDTPETTLTTGCTEATKSSPRIQALDRTVKDRDKESTKKCRSVIQPPHTIPVIRNGPDLKQSSDRTPHLDKYLNQSRKKYERRRLLPCRETLKPNCLIPLPPSRLPDQQGSEHKPLPPISEKAQLKHQSKLKPDTPETTLTTGCTEATKSSPRIQALDRTVKDRDKESTKKCRSVIQPPHTIPVIRNGPDLKQSSDRTPHLDKYLNQSRKKYERRRLLPCRETLKPNCLIPLPPSPLPDQQGSKHPTPKHEPSPPISKKAQLRIKDKSEHRFELEVLPPIPNEAQLKHSQTNLKSNQHQTTLTTGCAEARNDRVRLLPRRETLKPNFLIPLPPSPLPDQQGSEYKPLPPISEKAQLKRQSKLKPDTPETTLTTGCTEATKSSPRIQALDRTVKDRDKESTKKCRSVVQPPDTIPVIRNGPDLKQSSDRTPRLDKYLNQSRKKYERRRLLPCRETLKPNCLIPFPPSRLPDQQGSEHKPLPPISEKAQLKRQSKLKPDTPETTLTTGCTEATKSSPTIQALDRTVKDRDKESTKKCRSVIQPPHTIPVIRNGPDLKQSSDRTPHLDKYLNQSRTKYERVRLLPCRETLKPNCLIPLPPSPLPDQQGSEHKPLPPISEKAQLKRQSKLKPDTPETTLTTGCTEATKSSPRIQALDRTVKDRDKESTKKCRSVIQPPHTIPVIRNGPDLKQSSDRTPHLDKYLNQSRKKYERRRLLPCRETLKPNCLIPLPPSPLPDQQGSKHPTPKHEPSPPISKKAQLRIKDKSEHRFELEVLPPIPNEAQLKHSQTNLKSNQHQTTLTTGCAEARNDRVRLLPRRETLKPNFLIPLPPSPLPDQQGSEYKPLPPISEKAQLKRQSKLKPDTPETTLTTGCTEATKSSPRIQALDRTVKDRDKESTKKCRSVVQPPDTIPVIRNGPDLKQSSDRTPRLDKYLNQSRKKYERRRLLPCRETLKPNCLIPFPPSRLPDQQGSEHKPLPPISEKAQLKRQSKLKPDTPETTLTTGCTEATKSSPTIQALDRTVKDRDKESTKKCRSVVQPPDTIPVIRNGPDLKQSSDGTPRLDKYLNQSRKKYGRRRLLPCRETLKPNCLIPFPPSRLPDQQGSEHKPLPPISEKAQLKRQSKLKPDTPETTLTTGCTEATKSSPTIQALDRTVKDRDKESTKKCRSVVQPPDTIPVIRNGPDLKQSSDGTPGLDKYLNQSRKKYGRRRLLPCRETLKPNCLIPFPPSRLPDQQGSEHKPLPPISEKAQLKHQSKLKPDTPETTLTTGCTEATKSSSRIQALDRTVKDRDKESTKKCRSVIQPPHTIPVIRKGPDLKQSSDRTPRLDKYLNQYRNKNYRPQLLPCRETSKPNFLIPLPPSPLPDQQGYLVMPKYEPLPPISKKAQLRVEDKSEHRFKLEVLPPIPNKVQFKHSQTKPKTNPPETKMTTGCTESTKSQPTIKWSARRIKEKYDDILKLEVLPPIPNRADLKNLQTKLKLHAPTPRGNTQLLRKSSPRLPPML